MGIKEKRVEQLLYDAKKRENSNIALEFTNNKSSITYLQWYNDSVKLSNIIFTEIGGDNNIILQCSNNYCFICSLFAIFMSNNTAVPISKDIDTASLNHIIVNSNPKLIVLDENIESFCSDRFVKCFNFNDVLMKLNIDDENEKEYITASTTNFSNDIALIIYTSGSTKYPKGVICKHSQVLFSINAINSIIKNSSKDVILCGIPFSFDYGLYQIFLALKSGAKLVVTTDFSNPLAIPKWLIEHNITGLPGTPSLFQMLIESRLLERLSFPSLKYITSTGDVFLNKLIIDLENVLKNVAILPMYGLTECKRVSIMRIDEMKKNKGSVGKALPNVTVYVINEQGAKLSCNEIGELVVEGENVTSGYLNNPEETKKHFKQINGSNRYSLHTGDLFSIDSQGFLYFHGRKQGFVKIRGKRISPLSIENILNKVPQILQTVVVNAKTSQQQDKLFLFIRIRKNQQITKQKIVEISKDILPISIYPNQIIMFKRPFPVTSNGKIDRAALKKLRVDKYFD